MKAIYKLCDQYYISQQFMVKLLRNPLSFFVLWFLASNSMAYANWEALYKATKAPLIQISDKDRIENNASKEGRDYLTFEETLEIIRNFKSNSEQFAFNYPTDGCNVRAHLIGYQLARYGLSVEQVWISAPLNPVIQVTSSGWLNEIPSDEWIQLDSTVRFKKGWALHVATVIWVKSPDEDPTRRVIDPLLSELPLSFEDWAMRMQVGPDTHSVASSSDELLDSLMQKSPPRLGLVPATFIEGDLRHPPIEFSVEALDRVKLEMARLWNLGLNTK